MATGRDTQLTKQIGDYLVTAELGRLGLIATTFTGNVPHYDISACNPTGFLSFRSHRKELHASFQPRIMDRY